MEPAEYEVMYKVEETHWWYRALRRVLFFHLAKYLPDWREAALLDGGCGTGANLARLGNHARHIGVDLSAHALAFCGRRGLKNLVRGDVTSLPFARGAFSGVVSTSVLYHRWVGDLGQAIRESHRVLRDGGVLLVDLPAFRSLGSAHDEAVHTARRFTRADVCTLLAENGFKVCRVSYWNTLLFPLIWLVRRFGLLKSGRDFGAGKPPSGIMNRMFDLVMQLEFSLFRRTALPFGVSLSCVAVKQPPGKARGTFKPRGVRLEQMDASGDGGPGGHRA